MTSIELMPLKTSSVSIKESEFSNFCPICRRNIKSKFIRKLYVLLGWITIVQCPECKSNDPLKGFQLLHKDCADDSVFRHTTCVKCNLQVYVDSEVRSYSILCMERCRLEYVLVPEKVLLKS
jgi:hypothetical protein